MRFATRQVLIGMVAILVVLIACYRLIEDWLFFPTLAWFTATLYVAKSIRCPQCGRGQVFRGPSAFDIRLPSNRCYFCNSKLSNQHSSEGITSDRDNAR